jgi:hypothetical protein
MASHETATETLEQRRNVAAGVALVLILALGLVLRCIKLNESLWIDEINTYIGASRSLADCLVHRLYPLYYVLTHFVLHLGEEASILRAPSVAGGLLGIVAIYFLGKVAHGRVAGLVAAFLLAVSSFHIRHSQEARYYAFVALAATLVTLFLFKCVTSRRKTDWACYILACLLALSAHLMMVAFMGSVIAGAVLWIVFSPWLPTAKQKLAVLVTLGLCSLAGASGLMAVSTARKDMPLSMISLLSEGGADETHHGEVKFPMEWEAEDDTRGTRSTHRLTIEQFVEFLGSMFPFHHAWRGALAAALAFVGLVVAWRKSSALAVIVLSSLVLFPAPFFFVPVGHWFVPRYFIPLLPSGLLLISLGIAGVAGFCGRHCLPWVARTPNAEVAEAHIRRQSAGVSVVAVALILGLLGPALARSLAQHYKSVPEWDWRGMAARMLLNLAPRDVILRGEGFQPSCLAFYLSRMVPHKDVVLNQVPTHRVETQEDLWEAVRKFPLSTLWFVANPEKIADERMLETIEAFFDCRHEFGKVHLWVRGRPTHNLVPAAGFEAPDALPPLPPKVTLVTAPYSHEGAHSIQILAEPPRHGPRPDPETAKDRAHRTVARFPLVPVVPRLRNPGFEVWEDDAPVGWTVIGSERDDLIRCANDAGDGFAVAMAPGEQRTGIAQILGHGLLPGGEITVTAMGRAELDRQLALTLWLDYGTHGERVGIHHPGGADWRPMSLRATIPEHVSPGAVIVEFWREPGGMAEVLVDRVACRVASPQQLVLDPTTRYTLSMMLKCRDLKRRRQVAYSVSLPEEEKGEDSRPSPRVGRIVLTGKYANGIAFEHVLHRFGGTQDWHQVVLAIDSTTAPEGATDLAVEVGIYEVKSITWMPATKSEDRRFVKIVSFYEGTGVIWIDNLQFEEGERPTPLARGTRIPHDELLARLAPAN